MPQYVFTINANGNAVDQMKKIEKTLSDLGVKAQVTTQKVAEHFSEMGNKIKEHTSHLGEIIGGALGIGTIFAGGALIEKSVEHVNALNKAMADLNQTQISMSGASGLSNKEMYEMAESLDKISVASKPAIIAAEGMMATFGNIHGKQFKEGMQASADYASKFFHGDMVEAAKSLGIALDDPIKGMGRLHRTGVSFTEVQKEQIKHLQEQGKLTQAQEIILKEIKRETGGQAAAFANTDEGKLMQAKKQWDEIYERIGNIVNRVKIGMIPIIGVLVKIVGGVLDVFQSTSAAATTFKIVLGTIAALLAAYYGWLLLVKVGTELWTVATWALDAALSPIVLIPAAIIAVIVAVGYLWDKFRGFREFLGGMFAVIQKWIMGLVHNIVDMGTVLADVFTGKFSKALTDSKKIFTDFKKDFIDGWGDAINKGAEAAGNSTFKFSNLLSFNTGQKGPSDADGKGGAGAFGKTGIKDSAINTSNLSGAKGGLGEAKVVNIKIGVVQQNNGVKESAEKAENAAEIILRTVNNIGYSSSSTQ